ncbi:MAG: hypothetical protein JNL60_13740 [Bacteroidia bacterium]|nr:hypothetical protein [Bacteroidia bacterium]
MSKITLHNYEAYLLDYLEGNLDSSSIEELKQFALAHPELEIDFEDTNLPYITNLDIEADFKESLRRVEEPLEDEEALSYLEGLLDPEQKQNFELRLPKDPGLEKTLEDYKKTLLSVDSSERFSEKENLFKTEDDLVLADKTIAYLENQLSKEEKTDFEKRLQENETLRREYLLVSKTVLRPETDVVYPGKAELKEETRMVVLYQQKTVFRVAAAIILLAFLSVMFNYIQNDKAETKFISQDTKTTKTEQIVPEKTVLVETENKAIDPEKVSKPEYSSHLAQENGSSENDSVKPLLVMEKRIAEPSDAGKDLNTKKEESPENLLKQEGNSESLQLADRFKQEANEAALPADSNISNTYKITELVTIEESAEDELYEKSGLKEQKGLWKRAVQLAQRANKLGVKSVDGVEDSRNQQYRISFNSFSVEKK